MRERDGIVGCNARAGETVGIYSALQEDDRIRTDEASITATFSAALGMPRLVPTGEAAPTVTRERIRAVRDGGATAGGAARFVAVFAAVRR